jgi:hypothetical protein
VADGPEEPEKPSEERPSEAGPTALALASNPTSKAGKPADAAEAAPLSDEQTETRTAGSEAVTNEAGAGMEIHRPKAAHSWREFLIEIGTIVIGILIALGLEQSVDAVHEHGLAREAKEAIDAEMQEDLNRVAYRLQQQPCIEARLDEITGLLADWKGGKAPPAGLAIGDPGDVALVDQRWQANLNSGRFSRQSPAEQAGQAGFYTRLAVLDETEKREHYVWSQLRGLELGPGVLSADVRPNLIAALADARTDASDVRQLGVQVVAESKRAGLAPKSFREAAIAGSTCLPLAGARHG